MAVARGAVLAVVVIDSVGVTAGWVASGRTAEAIQTARRGIGRLIRRPRRPPPGLSGKPAPPAPGMPEQMPEPSEAPIVMSKELKDAIMALGKPTAPQADHGPLTGPAGPASACRTVRRCT